MPKLYRSIVAAVALLAAIPAAAQVYVFGDSFVDSGNARIGTLPFKPPLPFTAADPDQGYFQGRFGDGYNFADIISKRLTGGYATPYLAGGINYAVGGARAASDAFIAPFPLPIPGLPTQRAIYEGQFGGSFVDPNGTYLLVFGNNDVGAIQSGDIGPLTVSQYEDLYVANLVDAIQDLNDGGAKDILLFGVPNPNEAEGVALDMKLDAAIAALSPTLTSNFLYFDFFTFFAQLQAHPTAFGLTADVDFTTPCIAVQPVINQSVDCTGYFSFDGTHVTKPVQLEIARLALAQAGLATIPEPAVWLQLILGFGLTGSIMRARRQFSAI